MIDDNIKSIGREELVERIVSGERDFSNISVSDYEPHLPRSGLSLNLMIKLYEYFATQNFEKNPIIFNGSDLSLLSFDYSYEDYWGESRKKFKKGSKPLNLSYVRGVGTGFPRHCSNVSFHKADLSYADFSDCDLWRCDFSEASLYKANFCGSLVRIARGQGGADLTKSNLKGANVEGTNSNYTNFSEADIRGIKNLEKSENLERAKFYKTIADPREKKVVDKLLEKEYPRWKQK